MNCSESPATTSALKYALGIPFLLIGLTLIPATARNEVLSGFGFMGYQVNAVGDDIRAAASALEPEATPIHEQVSPEKSPFQGAERKACGRRRIGGFVEAAQRGDSASWGGGLPTRTSATDH